MKTVTDRWSKLPWGLSRFIYAGGVHGLEKGFRFITPLFIPFKSRYYSIHLDEMVIGWRIPVAILRFERDQALRGAVCFKFQITFGFWPIGKEIPNAISEVVVQQGSK